MTTPKRRGTPTSTASCSSVTVRVLLSYLPATAEELPLVEGESVVVTARSGDWLFGHPRTRAADGQSRCGWFPLVHVESPDEAEGDGGAAATEAEAEAGGAEADGGEAEGGEAEGEDEGEAEGEADGEDDVEQIELTCDDYERVSGTWRLLCLKRWGICFALIPRVVATFFASSRDGLS